MTVFMMGELALWNTPWLPPLCKPAVKKYLGAVCVGFVHWINIPLFRTTM